MVRKKSNSYKQLDISSAVKNKEIVISDDDFEDTKKNKSVSFFDFINDIRKTKSGTLLEEQTEAAFNPYMVLKGLSMKEEDIPICNIINKYAANMTKENLYRLLLCVIDKDYKFYPWIKSQKVESNDNIDIVAKYFECSKKEADEYINILGNEWAKSISDKYGTL